jgi:lipoate-protein ligase A
VTLDGWIVERFSGSAGDFHDRPLPALTGRRLWLFRMTGSALALGSAQPADHVDREAAARAGVEVVRRRSGGGAVLLQPGAVAWVDLLLPRDDSLWDDDVNRAAWWVGEAWARVLGGLGVAAEVHRARLDRAPWSERVCFAGLGAGEVSVEGRKVVGISQRRTRTQARFQCAVLLRWHPIELVELLALTEAQRAECVAAVSTRAVGLADLLGPGLAPGDVELERRFQAELPPV